MITTALIRPAFVADTLRHSVLECTYKTYVPHRVCRLVPADPRHLLADELQPYLQLVSTAKGMQVGMRPYVRPMVVKYPLPNRKHSK